MSSLKVNRVQLGQSGTASQNFNLGPPDAPDGSLRIRRGNADAPGAELLTIASDGKLSAGVNPATGVRDTSLATMQKFADEFLSSILPDGYQRLPSGLIMQWGITSFPASGTSIAGFSITFPIAFSTVACFGSATVHASANSSSGGYPAVGMPTLGLTGMQVVADTLFATTFNRTVQARWLAIGK